MRTRATFAWPWYALLFTALWPGLDDAWALIAAQELPIALVGEVVTLIGLFLARSAVFSEQPAAA